MVDMKDILLHALGAFLMVSIPSGLSLWFLSDQITYIVTWGFAVCSSLFWFVREVVQAHEKYTYLVLPGDPNWSKQKMLEAMIPVAFSIFLAIVFSASAFVL